MPYLSLSLSDDKSCSSSFVTFQVLASADARLAALPQQLALLFETTASDLLCFASPAVLAYTVAALSPNMDVANALLPTYVSTLLFFGGFLFTFDAIPPWWKWYSYINPLRYTGRVVQ